MIDMYDIASATHSAILLGKHWNEYVQRVQINVSSSFTSLVLPILTRRDWVLYVDRGDWMFGTAGTQLMHQFDYDPTDEDKRTLVDLFIIPIPGMPSHDFGMLMPSYGFPNLENNYQPEVPRPSTLPFGDRLAAAHGKTALYFNADALYGVVMHESQADDLDRIMLFDTAETAALAMKQVQEALETITYQAQNLVMVSIDGLIYVAEANTPQLEPIAVSVNYPWIKWLHAEN